MKVTGPNCSCYMKIVAVRRKGGEFLWLDVEWYSMVSNRLIGVDKWLKIPYKATKRWRKIP